tara:strand:+ start:68 stop:493 length:426 start_codon:yes stop_codon:yes gene_type:complete
MATFGRFLIRVGIYPEGSFLAKVNPVLTWLNLLNPVHMVVFLLHIVYLFLFFIVLPPVIGLVLSQGTDGNGGFSNIPGFSNLAGAGQKIGIKAKKKAKIFVRKLGSPRRINALKKFGLGVVLGVAFPYGLKNLKNLKKNNF